MVERTLETPTVAERLVSLVPLPYPLAALVWSAVLLGPVGITAVQLVLSGSTTFTLALLPNAVLNILLSLYLFLMVRYMRLRVVAAEALIAPRLSGGGETYNRVFGRLTQPGPPLALAATVGTLLLVLYAYSGTLSPNALLLAFNVLLVYINSLAFGTYIWEFASASWGLYSLGGASLQLAPFQEDRMMGSRPFGNLALTLTVAYFGALLLATLVFSTFLPSTVASTAAFSAVLVSGIALFFLPLTSIHGRMRAEKRRLLRAIGARYPRLEEEPAPLRSGASLDDVHSGLRRLTDLQEIDLLERKVASLPTWPFDVQVVSRFITIVLSVTAVLVARVVTDFLHI